MNKIQKLAQWLGNRQRKYADGLALFVDLAKKGLQDKYLDYFKQAPDIVGDFDQHFTMLVNILAKLERAIRQDPKLYPEAFVEDKEVKTLETSVKQEEVEKRETEIRSHQEQLSAMEERLSELKSTVQHMTENNLDADPENEAKISELESQMDDLESQINEHQQQIEQLKEEVAELNKPGVKVVTQDSLPTSLKKAYVRIQEIAPLYASLHADIADESKSDDDRKKLAEELCKLDDERRSLWKKIDDWSEGKDVKLEAARPAYSDNAVVRGYELARAVKRLKQNIATSQKSADKAKADGRQNIYDNAMERIAKYQQELAEIEKEIADEGSAE